MAFPLALVFHNPSLQYLTIGLMALIIISDFFDGIIARCTHHESPYGKILDPCADAFVNIIILFNLMSVGKISIFFVLFYIIRIIHVVMNMWKYYHKTLQSPTFSPAAVNTGKTSHVLIFAYFFYSFFFGINPFFELACYTIMLFSMIQYQRAYNSLKKSATMQ